MSEYDDRRTGFKQLRALKTVRFGAVLKGPEPKHSASCGGDGDDSCRDAAQTGYKGGYRAWVDVYKERFRRDTWTSLSVGRAAA
jgi:hypothetical protein